MNRYEEYDDDERPNLFNSTKARALVIGFIIVGVLLLRTTIPNNGPIHEPVQRFTSHDNRSQGTTAGVVPSVVGDGVTPNSGSVAGTLNGETLVGKIDASVDGRPLVAPNADAFDPASVNPGHIALREMLDAYQRMTKFREQSRILIEVDSPGRGVVRESIDLRLSYESPNRMRFVVMRPKNEITVACNGIELCARIDDSTTNNSDGQFVRRPAPRKIDVSTIFSATEFADPSRPNELLSALLSIPIDMTVGSLGMLTDQKALTELFQQANSIARLPDQPVGDVPCAVVRVIGRQGRYTFWIDQTTLLLRRIDHPVTRIVGAENLRDMPQTGGQTAAPTARIVTEHVGEQNPLFAAREFDLTAPEDAKLVRHFVAPPQDQDVALLNAKVPPFSFTDLNGDKFSSDQWDGKHALLIWFNDHPACRDLLASLRPVFEKYHTDNRVFACAISTDPPTTMGHQDVRNLAAEWRLPIRVVRDLDAVGRDVFAIQQAPTLIVTSPDPAGGSRIQLVEVGLHAEIADQLPVVLDQLLNGKNIAEDYIHFVERRQRDYQRYLAAASVDAPQSAAEIAPTDIAPIAEFMRLTLTPLWKFRDIESPGNITVDYTNGRPELLIHDGWHSVIRLDEQGTLISRPTLQETTDVSRLRALATPQSQTLFVGNALLGKHVAVFDSDWRQLIKYPDDAVKHSGVQDAVVTDLDADGKLEMYVGFAGIGGIHRVDLNGNRVWANTQLNSVLSMTGVDSDSGRQLLVTTNDGSLVPIDAKGHLGRPFSIGSRAVYHLWAGPVRANQLPWYCGLTYNVNGNMFVIGLDDQLSEKWNYPLPPGSLGNQVQVARPGQIVAGTDWQWLFAGPDGSVHVVSPDGQFFDHFNTGEAVHGLAGFRSDESHVLVVAGDREVTAYRVGRTK